MTNKHVFTENGFFCTIEQDDDEPLEQFYERGHFIVSQKPISIIKFNEAIIYSRIWINKKYLGCEYDENVNQKLKKMELNI